MSGWEALLVLVIWPVLCVLWFATWEARKARLGWRDFWRLWRAEAREGLRTHPCGCGCGRQMPNGHPWDGHHG